MGSTLLAYDGSPELTAAIPRFAPNGGNVVTLTVDLGQGGELDEVRERALAAGAVRAHVLDLREAFAREHLLPAMMAPGFLHPADVARPLLAKALVEIARIEGATTIAHGSTRDGAGGMTALVQAIDPARRVVSIAATDARPRPRVVANLWGRCIEGAERPMGARPGPSATDDAAHAAVHIGFEGVVPTSINGIPMTLVELIESLATIAGPHGVGRLASDAACACDAPAAVVLRAAWHARTAQHAAQRGPSVVHVALGCGACTVVDVSIPTEVR